MAVINADGTISGAPTERTGIDKVAWADQKVRGVMKVFDQIDAKIHSLSNPKKGEENPDAQKLIGKLGMQREALVKGLLTPEFFATAKMSSINNGDIYLKAVDPRGYAMLPEDKQAEIQKNAAALNDVGRVQRRPGMITSI